MELSDFNRLGLGGNTGVCDSFSNSTGSPGEGSPDANNAIGVDATGGSGEMLLDMDPLEVLAVAVVLEPVLMVERLVEPVVVAGGAVDWNQINVSGGGEGVAIFGGGGGSVVETQRITGRAVAEEEGPMFKLFPSSFLINSSIDDASMQILFLS